MQRMSKKHLTGAAETTAIETRSLLYFYTAIYRQGGSVIGLSVQFGQIFNNI